MVKKRKAFMNGNYDAIKAIKKAVEEKDYKTVELKAYEIMGRMDALPDKFPKGSTSKKSRASSKIWEKWDEFGKIPSKVKAVAAGLAKAATAMDQDQVQARFKALGENPYRAGACYQCHKDFRTSKRRSKSRR